MNYWKALLFLSLVCTSCAGRKQLFLFDNAESLMLSAPDSALAIMNSIDSSKIHGRATKARYSLLRTMALDKCYLDITQPYLLAPAQSWYKKHGSPDERLKMYFYTGRIAYDMNDLNSSAIAFSQAEAFAGRAVDKHAVGLLYLAFSDVYGDSFNSTMQKAYIEKALKVLEEANDSLYFIGLGYLAICYREDKNWEMADSLYREGLKGASGNSVMTSIFLSKYAFLKVLESHPDPAGAIELFDRKVKEFSSPLTVPEAGAYAYASELLGNTKTADAVMMQLEQMGNRSDATSWLSRIYYSRRNYQKAYDYLRRARLSEDGIIKERLGDSVNASLNDFHVKLVGESEKRHKIIKYIVLCVFILLFSYVLHLLVRRRKMFFERKRLLEAKRQMEVEMRSYQQIISDKERSIEESSALLERAVESYAKERLRRFTEIGRLSSTVWQFQSSRIDSASAWKELKETLDYVNQLETNGSLLVKRLDKDLDGEISRLRDDLNLGAKPKEVLFLCCCILRLDVAVVSDVMDISIDNVYKKRSRYKQKIIALGNQEYNDLFGI